MLSTTQPPFLIAGRGGLNHADRDSSSPVLKLCRRLLGVARQGEGPGDVDAPVPGAGPMATGRSSFWRHKESNKAEWTGAIATCSEGVRPAGSFECGSCREPPVRKPGAMRAARRSSDDGSDAAELVMPRYHRLILRRKPTFRDQTRLASRDSAGLTVTSIAVHSIADLLEMP